MQSYAEHLFNCGAESVQHFNFCIFFQNQKSYKESKKRFRVTSTPSVYGLTVKHFEMNIYFDQIHGKLTEKSPQYHILQKSLHFCLMQINNNSIQSMKIIFLEHYNFLGGKGLEKFGIFSKSRKCSFISHLKNTSSAKLFTNTTGQCALTSGSQP